MSLEHIHLRKLLRIMGASERQQRSLLRADIRQGVKKELGLDDEGGGDFHTPFWSDAKNHVTGASDLRKQTLIRISSNGRRKRLYPLLTSGFIKWHDKCSWQNEKIKILTKNLRAQHHVSDLGIIKVENILGLKIKESTRIIYPYFSEDPALSEEEARLGLWLIGQALPDYKNADIEILDVLRSRSFSTVNQKLKGSEEDAFTKKYKLLLKKKEDLKKE